MTIKLCLIGIKKVDFKDGATKYKYVFIGEAGTIMTGWNDEQKYQDLVLASDSYDETRARAWQVEADEFQGKLRYRVVVP